MSKTHVPHQDDITRAALLLRLAAEYIEDNWPEETIFYDDTTCDGYCLAEDCRTMAEMIAGGEDE